MTLAPAIIAAAVSLVVSVLTVFLTPAVTSLRVRREAINTKFDAAIEALLLVQAARHAPMTMQRGSYQGTDEEYRLFTLKMAENSLSQFIEQTTRARSALAAISNYVPEAREWITSGWELTQEREPEQREIIEENRTRALKTERLFRQSKRLTVNPKSERAITRSPD
jgi:hypothetical protein